MPEIKGPPHLLRMIEEDNDLSLKMLNLDSFIGVNPIYENLTDRQKELLSIQLGCMTLYRNALRERIELEPREH